ncbi:rho GDP-dissociation inhibitor 1 isoform X2 [Hevea brasiliensis]|uniref:rho GDP-dissociation inhibitor 1 isoform X2 n=1 Tax=Hevea brasiliensis TaxID=3981 RepID=UPI0025EA0A78|nr:rho GDP-dissociation inhibitor 1 isoform X2 [Hevea brasiliensis]
MEGGKGVEAGPSTAGVVSETQERQKKMTEKAPAETVIDDGEEEEEDNGVPVAGFVPGPLLSLKEQIEKDKDDDSLRRWKEKLLGCVEGDLNGQMEPEVKFHSIGIICNDFGEINTPLPVDDNQSDRVLFTLKEGSRYQLKLTFSVLHNIVSGLTYTNTVWKKGLQGTIQAYFGGGDHSIWCAGKGNLLSKA